MAWSSCQTDYWNAWTNNSSVDKNVFFTKDNMKKYLPNEEGLESITYNPNGDSTVIYQSNSNVESNMYIVDSSGKVKEIKKVTFMFQNTEYNVASGTEFFEWFEENLNSIYPGAEINSSTEDTFYIEGNTFSGSLQGIKVNGVAKNLDYILTDGDEIVLYAAVAHSGGDGR